jgi:prepilin-type N-terminal cleavage/methylation domain-containing protein
VFGPPSNRRAPRRSAFTLLELMLVLALIVAISALAMPSFRGAMTTWRLRSAADQIRAAWNRTRSDAIRDGEVYVFRFLPRSGHYIAAPWPDGGELPVAIDLGAVATNGRGEGELTRDRLSDASSSSPPPPRQSQQQQEFATNKAAELPDDVMFLGLAFATQASADEAVPIQDAGQAAVPSDGWSAPILFFPDGTTSAVRLYLQNDREQLIDVTLRAMTGTSRVGEIQSLDGLLR